VRATDVRSKIVAADSSGGGVFVGFVAAPDDVRVSSSGGSAVVEVPHDETSYRADVTSSGGSREVGVKTDPESTHIVKIDSSGDPSLGGVTVDQYVGGQSKIITVIVPPVDLAQKALGSS